MRDPWTILEYEMLKVHRGERSPAAKLTDEQAEEIIRRNLAGERHKILAEEFGVSVSTVSKLALGLRWSELLVPRRTDSRRDGSGNHLAKLTEAQVRAIRAAQATGTSYRELARQYGVASSSIQAIIQRRTWKQLT